MCLKELMDELRQAGTDVSESQIRWAIKTGKLSRPRVDGSFRFDFSEDNVAEIVTHFAKSEVVPC
jgi:hypothetical protein